MHVAARGHAAGCGPGLAEASRPPRRPLPGRCGAGDVLARKLAEALGDKWKQTVIIDNKPRAAESMAAVSVARSKPDGYKFLLATEGALQP